MSAIVLILVVFLSNGQAKAAATTFSSVRQCNITGEQMAATALKGAGVRSVLWRCEDADTGNDAPLKVPSCAADDQDCRAS